jgi:hypothetical protein
MKINKYIFYTLCNKDIEEYDKIMDIFRKDYIKVIKEIKETTSCKDIRFLVHKLIGIISVINNTNDELNYILKSILLIPKTTEDFDYYRDYIYMLLNFYQNLIGL